MKTRKGKESCLLKVQEGDLLTYHDGRIVEFVDYIIAPNGIDDPKLILVLIARTEEGNLLSATSDKFTTVPEEDYEECYPSVRMSRHERTNKENETQKACESCGKENVTIAPYPIYTFFGLIKVGVKYICMICFLGKESPRKSN